MYIWNSDYDYDCSNVTDRNPWMKDISSVWVFVIWLTTAWSCAMCQRHPAYSASLTAQSPGLWTAALCPGHSTAAGRKVVGQRRTGRCGRKRCCWRRRPPHLVRSARGGLCVWHRPEAACLRGRDHISLLPRKVPTGLVEGCLKCEISDDWSIYSVTVTSKACTNPVCWEEDSCSAAYPLWSWAGWPPRAEELLLPFVWSSDSRPRLSSSPPADAGRTLCWCLAAGCRGCCHLTERTSPPAKGTSVNPNHD